MKEDMSLSNLGTVALHAAKVPTNVFSSPLICILTLDYYIRIWGYCLKIFKKFQLLIEELYARLYHWYMFEV